MRNIYKIVIIVFLFAASLFIALLIIRPALVNSGNHLISIGEEEEINKQLNAEFDSYIKEKDRYYLLNAEYQKLSMELPDSNDVPVLTDEFYEIARYTGIGINSLAFTESAAEEDDLAKIPVREIMVDIVIEGSYYEILNFVNTIEIMPRIAKVENMIMQVPGADYDNLLTFITAKTYYKNKYYKQ
jgi:Tfp pilus assembly protein PilO